jgi:endonuclease/exonuclease/phosphatase family metal-dependent hydrolase
MLRKIMKNKKMMVIWKTTTIVFLCISPCLLAFVTPRKIKRQSMHSLSVSLGRMTVRIVPSSRIEYEQLKPKNRRYPRIETLIDQLPPQTVDHLPSIHDTIFSLPNYIAMIDIVVSNNGNNQNDMIQLFSQRDPTEPAAFGLKRLTSNLMGKFTSRPQTLNLSKKVKKSNVKPSKSSQTLSKEPTIRLGNGANVAIGKQSHFDLWKSLKNENGSIISFPLKSGSVELELDCFPPTILSIQAFEQFEQKVFCGVPLVVSAEMWHSEPNSVRISWFSDGILVLENSNCFVPTVMGSRIQVLIEPLGNPAWAEAYEFTNRVESMPLLGSLQNVRREWKIPRTDDNRLRVLTYNLLADQYVKGNSPQINFCAKELLHRSLRMPLLMSEILSYHADIICLQEVDVSIFHSYYNPLLQSQGYQGFFAVKFSGQQEGCAIFWSLEKFLQVNTDSMFMCPIRDLLSVEIDDEWGNHIPFLQEFPHIRNRIKQLGQVFQWVVLKSKEDESVNVTVGNTHLYYHPSGDHIRLLQAYAICRKLSRTGCSNIILCGDLNSDPESGAMHLLLHRSIDADHPTAWNNLFGDTPKTVLDDSKDALKFTLPDSFPVLLPSILAPYTHCIPSFIATLDYILSTLKCLEAAPMPSKEFPKYMPNIQQPSDHLSLVADYKWGEKKG